MANWIQRFLTAIATHGDLTDHDKAAHDALNIDADTVDGDHKTDLENTMDSKITTHKGDASAHHAKYTDAEAITAAKTDTALLNPSGVILMWHGTIANIPTGWLICDGNNSTPNLLARFVQGVATAATDPGATGGALSKSHVSHKHTMGTHSHTVTPPGTINMDATGAGYYVWYGTGAGSTNSVDPGDTNSTTVSSHSDIRPPFYDIAYIMKT